MKKLFKVILALLVLVLLFGCTAKPESKETAPETKEPVKVEKPVEQPKAEMQKIVIGSILPLTGDAGDLGKGTKEAAEMAVEEINKDWAKDNMQLEIIFEDGQCNPKEATTAATKLANFDKVKVVLGALCSGETLSAAPIFEKAKIAAMSPCSSNPKVRDAGDYIFRDYPSDAFLGVATATYVYNDLGYKKVGILFSQSDWGTALKDVFVGKFKELGGEVVAVEGIEDNTTDVKTQLTKIKAAKPDFVYLPLYAGAGAITLKQMKELGIDSPVVGGDAMYDDQVVKNAGDSSEGFESVIGYAKAPQEWQDKYKAKYGHDVRVCAANGYDAAKILAQAIKEVGYDGTKVKDYIYALKDYQGVSGVINFDDHGDLVESKYAVMKVKNGKFEEVKVGSA